MSLLSNQPKPEHLGAPVALDSSTLDPSVLSPAFDVVVIGASAGGLTALSIILGGLPASFPAAVAVVLHLSPDHPSVLTEVLARITRLTVRWAIDGTSLTAGTVLIAPPDRHLVLTEKGTVSLLKSQPVHFARPSVDLLFASAARTFGARALAVILSGNGSDGTAGVAELHRQGSVVIAQDEASSEYFSMPREAIGSGGVTFVLPLSEIAPAIRRLVALGVTGGGRDIPPAAL